MNEKRKKKVLVVEDDLLVIILCRRLLEGSDLGNDVDLIVAESLEKAEDILSLHNDFDIIFWDLDLGNGETSLELTKATRARFPHLLMVATSANILRRKEQMDYGCNYEIESKREILMAIQALLFPISLDQALVM